MQGPPGRGMYSLRAGLPRLHVWSFPSLATFRASQNQRAMLYTSLIVPRARRRGQEEGGLTALLPSLHPLHARTEATKEQKRVQLCYVSGMVRTLRYGAQLMSYRGGAAPAPCLSGASLPVAGNYSCALRHRGNTSLLHANNSDLM